MSATTIKEYLVGLGFNVDTKSYNEFIKKINESSQELEKGLSKSAKAYVSAAAVIVSGIAAITSATAALIDKTAQADLQYKKFGLRMYMTNALAKELKISTDALGESLDNIAWMPELRQRYFALMQQARGMETPKDADSQLKFIRDIRFEFTRMKIEANYATQWLTYFLVKNLNGPLHQLHDFLVKFNDWITRNMIGNSARLAQGLTVFFNLLRQGARAIFDLWAVFRRLWDMMPTGGKLTGGIAGFVALGSIPVIGPFLQACIMASAIIGGVLLLIDDFYGYIEGKKSSRALSPVWKMLLSVFRDLNFIGRDIILIFKHFFGFLSGDKALDNTTKRFENMVSALKWLSWIISGMAGWLTLIFRVLLGLVDTLGLLLTGKFKEAQNRVKGIIDDAKQGYKDINDSSPTSNDFVSRIKKHESGGNYRTINADSGAMGAYQIMPYNWRNWAKEAGLGLNVVTTQENQDKVAAFKLNQYLAKYGDERLAAVAWYKGEATADSIAKGKPAYNGKALDLNKKFGKYDSINDYVFAVTGQTFSYSGLGYLASGMKSYTDIYNQSASSPANTVSTVEVGDVTVNVNNSNANPHDIYVAVSQGISNAVATKRASTQRNLKDAQSRFK